PLLGARDRLGAEYGWRAVTRAVGVPPWWLTTRLAKRGAADATRTSGAFSSISCAILLLAMAALTFVGLRRRRRDVVAAVVMALWGCVALGAAAAATPRGLAGTLGYTVQWGSTVGMWA